MNQLLLFFVAGFALLSIFMSSRAKTTSAFFYGSSVSGQSPGLLTLVLSQVTTWLFARSLMNAAILGFYYGLWGTLAYAAYYLSFLTGAKIVDSLRFRHGFSSIQHFLRARFGRTGTSCYNFVIGIRLISEVFANLLVIGILFGVAGSMGYTATILAFAAVTLGYSAMGGLQASLRTDVFQMIVFLITLVVLIVLTMNSGAYSIAALCFKTFVATEPGPVLLMVALLQVWSYPMHDPVMMDRGFLADRQTTRKSFLHAAWISVLCITAFGSLGILAGANATSGEAMNEVLTRMLGDVPMLLFSAALVISAMSTLDNFQRLDTRGLGLFIVLLFPENLGFVIRVQFKTVTADQVGCVRSCCHHQRSTSAITKSILPRWAIRSGTKPPRITAGICCRCGKLGVRMRVR